MLDRSIELIDSMAEDDILLSTSLSLEQYHRDETDSNINKTAIDILCIVLVVYRTANKNLFI